MTAMPPRGQVVRVKPQPNIYTVLLLVAILALLAAIGIVMHNLMTVYGLSFGELFVPQKFPQV